MSSDYNSKIQLAEAKLQKAIRYANNGSGMSPFEQQEATRKILEAQMEFNNSRAEIGHITKQHADIMNADISYQLKLFENNKLRQGNAPNTIVMAHLYEAQMEYLEKIKMRSPQTESSSSNNNSNNNSNSGLDDWRAALIQQSIGNGNSNNSFNDNTKISRPNQS